ncbi:MAG TPA: PIN domain-containing protein [Gaiella sp.]
MAVAGWVLDKSAVARSREPGVRAQLEELAGLLWICPVGELEQLYSTRSAADYDALATELRDTMQRAPAPPDLLDRALALQRDLAHHHGLWHRTSIPDLLIAETALHHSLGIVHVDGDYDRIAEVRPLTTRRLR